AEAKQAETGFFQSGENLDRSLRSLGPGAVGGDARHHTVTLAKAHYFLQLVEEEKRLAPGNLNARQTDGGSFPNNSLGRLKCELLFIFRTGERDTVFTPSIAQTANLQAYLHVEVNKLFLGVLLGHGFRLLSVSTSVLRSDFNFLTSRRAEFLTMAQSHVA